MEPSVSRRKHTSKNEIIPSSDSSSEVNWMVDSMVDSTHHPPRAWKRYVDDTWAILQKDLVEEFLHHLNTIESSSQAIPGPLDVV